MNILLTCLNDSKFYLILKICWPWSI